VKGHLPGTSDDPEQQRKLACLLFGAGFAEWILCMGGSLFFDREMQATITPLKAKSAHTIFKTLAVDMRQLVEKNINDELTEPGSSLSLIGSTGIRRPPAKRVNMNAHNGLRGLCAMWILLFHLFAGRIREMKQKSPVWGYRYIVLDLQGCAIMPLFFILSGFSMAVVYGGKWYRLTIYGDELDGQQFDRWTYYKARFARVMPGYYLSNLAALPLLWMGFGPFDPADTKSLVGSTITNLIPVNTLFNCQLPPWPYGKKFDSSDPSTFGMQSPLLLKSINGPAWTIGAMIWFWFLFPSTIVRVQRWNDTALYIGIGICYWVQQLLIHVCFWFMEKNELGNNLNHWMMAPGDVAFNFAALNPISRLPVFLMGVLAGMLCIRHADEPSLPYPKSFLMILPPVSHSALPRAHVHRELPLNEQRLGNFGERWWARITDRTAGILVVLFATEIVIDFYVLNVVHLNERFPQGLAGAVWLQGFAPYGFLTLTIGLTQDGSRSRTARFFNTRGMQWLGAVGFSIYLVHFPFMGYLIWAQGTLPVCYPDCKEKPRMPFETAHANWAANDPLAWYLTIANVAGSTLLGWLMFRFFEEPMRKRLRA